MLPTERVVYSAITERAPLKLPGGARMAVWIIVNVEEWDAREPMPRTVLTPPAGGSPMPDIPNWAWHEYGNRVGFWRFVEVFDALSIPAVLAINGSALAAYQAIVRAALDREWEFIGHGFSQRNMQKVENERADIRRTREVIAEATGRFMPSLRLIVGPTRSLPTTIILASTASTIAITQMPAAAAIAIRDIGRRLVRATSMSIRNL
jgi:allantoinase